MAIVRSGRDNPKFTKSKMPWESTLYLGVELELETSKSSREYANPLLDEFDKFQSKTTKQPMFFYKTDGSINYGFEFVTHPFTLQYSKNFKLKETFAKLRDLGFLTKSNCGLHVHISKNQISPLEKEKLRLFFSKNKQQIFQFSGRDNPNNCYCSYENYGVKEFLYGGASQGGRGALNLNSNISETIEIRAFAATLDEKKFKAILEFCHILVEFVKDVGITHFIYGNSWKTFQSYVRNQFPLLYKYVKSIN